MMRLYLSLFLICLILVNNPIPINASNVTNVLNKTDTPIENDNYDDYVDYTDESDSGKIARQRNIYIIRRVGTTYAWCRWEKWTKCANSCVQIKRRQCVERILNSSTSLPIDNAFYPQVGERVGCFGILKRYRLCKDEKCRASNMELRDEQCASFNTLPFKGKFYNWLGYEREHNECELFCRPSESEHFVAMNQSVMDGTPCERPAVYYTHAFRRKAVCVEGICRSIIKALY